MSSSDAILRPMTVKDLEMVLAWRNHPEIRRYMFTRHEIKHEEHQRWFVQSLQDTMCRLLICVADGEARGFVHFSGVSDGGIADWGFYAAPDAPKGTGRMLGHAALRFGFRTEGLHKICGRALECNQPSIGFHRMLGFREEGILRDQYRDGTSYHSVVCFGLLQHEWTAAVAE